jgi:K+-sensing histidine kinase KdpD
VQWVMENGQPAGRGTATLASASMAHHPLVGPRGVLGVASIGGEPLGPEQSELLHVLLRHVTLVLSVEGLDEERRRTAREMETERLRSSISPPYRTTCALHSLPSWVSASSLQEQADKLEPELGRNFWIRSSTKLIGSTA